MKKYLLLIFPVFIGSWSTFSQEILDIAAKTPDYNQQGDPVNNITDPDGARQGDWYYVDSNNDAVVLKKFTDHSCVDTYFKLDDKWISSKEFASNESIENSVATELHNQGIELDANQQVLIILNESGQVVTLFTLGNWSESDSNIIRDIIQNYFQSHPTLIPGKTYLLL
ncbi:MAG: hypothetical protein HUJ25_05885 [Crocinitomicaceae bacterium]|nr:hypothetical protein [Crocinitomicaceae bacterium]